ncbi:hypothetical protein KIN20_025384 [Parelaphostrongylus tenuis]|uniref:Uncharacterized protein n=1 Tax=Parelaphostrongylus tenuis TaxID=148309 RepID=A0AAD5QWL7_PARTN|nr:hypothetical protein KIN20_025384 [Parelaphostrongylus tenuis]
MTGRSLTKSHIQAPAEQIKRAECSIHIGRRLTRTALKTRVCLSSSERKVLSDQGGRTVLPKQRRRGSSVANALGHRTLRDHVRS